MKPDISVRPTSISLVDGVVSDAPCVDHEFEPHLHAARDRLRHAIPRLPSAQIHSDAGELVRDDPGSSRQELSAGCVEGGRASAQDQVRSGAGIWQRLRRRRYSVVEPVTDAMDVPDERLSALAIT